MTDQLVRQKDELPNPGTVDGIIDVLGKILAKPFIQSILISETGILVDWLRAPEDRLFTEVAGKKLMDILNTIEIIELDSDETPRGKLLDAQFLTSLHGFSASHIMCSTVKGFRTWLSLPQLVQLPYDPVAQKYQFAGMYIVETDLVPEHSILLAGGKVRSVDTDNILFGVRISVGEQDNG